MVHSIILEVSVLLLFLWCLWRVCLSQSWLIASPCTKRLTYQTIEKLSIVWLHPGGVVPRYPQVSWRTWPIGFRKNPVGPMGYHSVYAFGSNMEQFLGTEHQKPLSNKPTCNMFGHVPCYIWPYPSISPSIQIIWAKSPVHPSHVQILPLYHNQYALITMAEFQQKEPRYQDNNIITL